MFTNIFLISLLSLISLGRTNGEDSSNRNLRGNAFSSLLDVPIPQQYEDLNFFKYPRMIRTPFRNSEIMTARGFGKRAGQNMDYGSNDEIDTYGQQQQLDRWQRPILFPFIQDALRIPRVSYNNVAVPKRNDIKFRLNDGNLRIGRGFGKRSYFLDTQPSNSFESSEMKAFDDNSQLKPKETKEEA